MGRLRLLALFLAIAACSSGSDSSDRSSRGEGGSSPPTEGTLILPLIGEPPAGLNRQVLEPALAAAEQGLGFDLEQQRPVPIPIAPSEILIRPGVEIFPESIFPGWCTAAFVFDNRTRIATAGHCTQPGDAVLAIAAPSTIFVIGFTSRSAGADADAGNDWALIDILPIWQPFTDPAVALVGGPCGRNHDPALPVVKYVGHGAVVGTAGTARGGLLLGEEDGAFLVLGPTHLGDSGAPVLETTQTDPSSLCIGGGAVGIITVGEFLTLDGIPVAPTGFFIGTPISRIGNSLVDAGLSP